jgi:diadenosine tetraphosphatase ApaH/serine/threonine PP2A family protein phosphatase
VLACLYDVHGNLAALEAVVADARSAGARRWILGGDYALMGPKPAETFAALRELEGSALWIRGNTDRWLAEPPGDPAIDAAVAWTREQLGDVACTVLSSLPPSALFGDDTRICHASPPSDMESFLPEPAESDAGLLNGVEESRVLFGHTHVQFRRMHEAIELVNPGSVGIPLDGDPRPGYALIDEDGGLELRRVAYDHEAVAAELDALGTGWSALAARRIRESRP